jgi:exodeoxyribonuclease V alpha subunit
MLQRNLLYTRVTRGKRSVVLVEQKKAVAIAVRNASGRGRWSNSPGWAAGLVHSSRGELAWAEPWAPTVSGCGK